MINVSTITFKSCEFFFKRTKVLNNKGFKCDVCQVPVVIINILFNFLTKPLKHAVSMITYFYRYLDI